MNNLDSYIQNFYIHTSELSLLFTLANLTMCLKYRNNFNTYFQNKFQLIQHNQSFSLSPKF